MNWKTLLYISIPTAPVAQPRVKAASRGGKAMVYTPTRIGKKGNRRQHPIIEFKGKVKAAVAAAWNRLPVTGPVRVDAVFVFRRASKYQWKTRPMPRLPHTQKPDRDNVDKAILDALSGLVWKDDYQVCSGQIEKWIAAGDEQPHVELRISVMLAND